MNSKLKHLSTPHLNLSRGGLYQFAMGSIGTCDKRNIKTQGVWEMFDHYCQVRITFGRCLTGGLNVDRVPMLSFSDGFFFVGRRQAQKIPSSPWIPGGALLKR